MPQPTDPGGHAAKAAIDGATKPRFGEVTIRDRGRLPHWEREMGTYFVTFRLADSLPRTVLEKIIERHRVLESAKRSGLKLLPAQEKLAEEYSPKRVEEYLDSGKGACCLRDARIAEVMANALRYWEGKKYRLMAWCVMPNHVHVVLRLFPEEKLSELMRSWKSYTAGRANRLLGRSGELWQREYYDRLIRDGAELERAIDYVVRNPEQAGLSNWRWVWGEDGSPTSSR